MRLLSVALLAAAVGLACSDPAPPPPAPEELPEPAPTPAADTDDKPARVAPMRSKDRIADAGPSRVRPRGQKVQTKPAAKPKPAATAPSPQPAKGSIVLKGDAKTVVFLGDGNDRQYKDGGDAVTPGAYKVKAWFVGDPVPKVVTSVTVTGTEAVTVTCSSKGKWCREGDHPVESMDTGQ